MTDSVRLFVAAELSLETVREIAETSAAMAAALRETSLRVRWVPPAHYHVTLKYIGWTEPETLWAIRDTVAAGVANTSPIEIHCAGVGAFPKPERARVLWVGTSDSSGRLAQLAERLDTGLAELGFPLNKNPFVGHVTLGRLRQTGDVRQVLLPWTEHVYSKSFVDSIVLFQSVMKPDGSEYVERARWALERSSKQSKRHTGRVQRGPTTTQTHAEQDHHGNEIRNEVSRKTGPERDPG